MVLRPPVRNGRWYFYTHFQVLRRRNKQGGDYNRIFQVDQMDQTVPLQPSLLQALEPGFRPLRRICDALLIMREREGTV